VRSRPGYEAPKEITGPAASRSIEAGLGVFVTAVNAGAADSARSQVPANLEEGALWRSLPADHASSYEAPFAGIVLSEWASVLGFLVTEFLGACRL
jgi:hypothetical protein